ncbi:hypothetical protein POTOM_030683 [Populus tomentosa]|uniref:Uncharacterized protein n=1 Tax=Populus tomentosa TaxID=118781 RepID=A0A8X8CV63_POPTO|nr:hypothetical protein POTOM_030683 [Populus tomentosa]
MASKTHVPVSATQGTTPSLLSFIGFSPIRAPITVDDFQSDGYKTNSSESNISGSSSVDNEFTEWLLMERDDGPDNIVLGPKDAVVMNGSVSDSDSVNLVEDNSHVVTVIQPINLLVNYESPETSKGD